MTTLVAVIAARTRALALKVRLASRWQRALIAFLAGALSVLAMAPFFLSPVLLVTLALLVWLIDGSAKAGDGANHPGAPEVLDGRTGRSEIAALAAALTRFDKRAMKRAALVGWFFGFGYFLFGMFWIGEAFLVEAEKFAWLLPAAVTLLPAGLALFFAFAAVLARLLWRPGMARVFVLASALGLSEGLRGHIFTGLPWNTLGYALTWPLTLMQSAGLVGIYGLTVLAVLAFASPFVALAEERSAGAGAGASAPSWSLLRGVALGCVIVSSLWVYGAWRLSGDTGARVAGVKLRLVQPSVPQREKWLPEKQREIFDLHVDLSRHNRDGVRDDLKGITHLIWPEAAMPFLPLDSPQALKEIGELLPDNVYLISGALRVEWPAGATGNGSIPRATDERTSKADKASNAPNPAPRRAFNSLMVFGPDGGLVATYDKIHLVPFGEYLPFQGFLESIGLEQLTRMRGGFTAGWTPRPLLDVPNLPPFIALVCYEAIFPGVVVQGTQRPNLIINLTNDGWFGNTTGPRQHFHMARVRAVEEGLPLIRVANNGISAVFDGYGHIITRINLDRRGVSDSTLPVVAPSPLYVWLGDVIYIIYMVVSLVWFAGASLRAPGRG